MRKYYCHTYTKLEIGILIHCSWWMNENQLNFIGFKLQDSHKDLIIHLDQVILFYKIV